MGQQQSAQPELSQEEKKLVLGGEPTMKQVVARILRGEVNHVVVVAGAGMSVAAGIPDFRSPSSGLYANLQKFQLPRPESIFDIDYFRRNPVPFFQLAKDLWPGELRPTKTHYFLRLMQDKGILGRVFTQNIDTLERIAGLEEDKLVEAHGSFHKAYCVSCFKEHSKEEVKKAVFSDEIPKCTTCDCIVKPAITFFGESLPARFSQLFRSDCAKCDLLIVIGTSLQVAPVSMLPSIVRNSCPRMLFNREKVAAMPEDDEEDEEAGDDDDLLRLMGSGDSSFRFGRKDNYRDVFVKGDCDDGITEFAAALGWTSELDALVSSHTAMLEEQYAKDRAAAAASESKKSAAVATVAATAATETADDTAAVGDATGAGAGAGVGVGAAAVAHKQDVVSPTATAGSADSRLPQHQQDFLHSGAEVAAAAEDDAEIFGTTDILADAAASLGMTMEELTLNDDEDAAKK